MLLCNLELPQQVFSDSDSDVPYIFCDASKAAYGFVVYISQESKAVLLFSKAKVAPTVTLELLSAYLTLKSLKNIRKALALRICLWQWMPKFY